MPNNRLRTNISCANVNNARLNCTKILSIGNAKEAKYPEPDSALKDS